MSAMEYLNICAYLADRAAEDKRRLNEWKKNN